MKSLTIRLSGLVAVGLLGLGLGLFMRTPTTQDVALAYAEYPSYGSLADLSETSDAVIRGIVEGRGEPFMDYGVPVDGDTSTKGDAIAMRLFSVRVLGPEGSTLARDQLIQVAVTDAKQYGISGDAHLADGDEVFLFLEELDNSTFKVDEVKSSSFYVAVGGSQGVFREFENDQWRQDENPHLIVEQEEHRGADFSTAMVVTEKELEDAASDG